MLEGPSEVHSTLGKQKNGSLVICSVKKKQTSKGNIKRNYLLDKLQPYCNTQAHYPSAKKGA